MVLAKWYSGDRGMYPARITSITGSKSDPVYIVKFKNYDTTETLRLKDIRPISNPNKRKADGAPAVHSPAPPQPQIPGVISAAPDIDEVAAAQHREPSKVSDGPPRPAKMPKKIKATKELEAGKNKWQDWASKGKGMKKVGVKKESMFRTPEGVHGRVGFIGSGQTMRKDPTRSRHIYQMEGGEEGA
jgi:survival-of-motor-neuron-related-splicing factor 30